MPYRGYTRSALDMQLYAASLHMQQARRRRERVAKWLAEWLAKTKNEGEVHVALPL